MNLERDRGFFDTGMFLLCETFQRESSRILLDAYWSVLSGLTREEFSWAIERSLEEATFFPKPAELKRQAAAMYSKLGGREAKDIEARQKREQEARDREIREWSSDPKRVERGKRMVSQLTDHALKHPQGLTDGCASCLFEKTHPKPYLHLRAGLVAADVNWDLTAPGCCAPEEPEDRRFR